MSTQSPPTTISTQFSQQVAYLGRGSLDAELTEALASVVKAVRETGKSGVLTLQLKVSKLNARDENAVKITPRVATKKPELAPYESVMFSTYDGDLLRNDPNQRQLDLQEVPKPGLGPLQHVGNAPQQ